MTKRLIYQPSFSASDRTLNFHRAGRPVHDWYTHSCTPSDPDSGVIHNNTEWIDIECDEASDIAQFAVSIPFHGMHTADVTVTYTDAKMCQTSFLAIATSKYDNDDRREDAFIVQSIMDTTPTTCDHTVNLDAGRHSTVWKPLALLAGYRQGTSSLGTILAISPNSTHIAAATWDTLLVWSFDPKMLHQSGLEHYLPTVDFNVRKDFGRLRPVKLKGEGIVHKMCWVGETTLYTITDRGLVRYECGPSAQGHREELTLQ